MSSPMLSLIIPTRERADTLAYALRSALEQKSDAFEIVVSDNFSADETPAVVAALDDPRLCYFRSDRRLSMCDNYEFALQKARGAYVCFIGDDDAVTPRGIDYLIEQLSKVTNPTIHMWPMHVYDWPSSDSAGRIAHLAPQGEVEALEIRELARVAVRLGGWKYYRLPSPYHCAVPRWMLDEIAIRTGRVFNSTQPDVFTAMALPAYASHAIRLNKMVTLHGRSPRSNGAGFVKRSAQTNIDRFVREYGEYAFHPTLDPEAPAAANMIPDAVLIAKDFYPEIYGQTSFNYSAMWAFVCRLGFEKTTHVIRRLKQIRNFHDFSIKEFLKFYFVHQAALVRRKVLDRAILNQGRHVELPTILDFIDMIVSERSVILPHLPKQSGT